MSRPAMTTDERRHGRHDRHLLQLRPVGAGREVARFVVNTTAGVAGIFDVASLIDLDKSDADTGETLALYGLAAGPYLVLPTMPPLTLRDATEATRIAIAMQQSLRERRVVTF